MKVGFIGAGNLAAAHAEFVHRKGYEVLLSGLSGHHGVIPAVEKNGNRIDVTDGTSFPVKTGSIAEALRADFTFLTVPGDGHEAAVDELAKYPEELREAKLIVTPGNMFALLLSRKVTSENFPKVLAATTTSPYASRIVPGTAEIGILGTKNQIEIAGIQRINGVNTQLSPPMITATFSGLFPQTLVPYADLATIFFGCTNAVVHPPAILGAAERIEKGETLRFYTECVPPAVLRIQHLDEERVMLVARLGRATKTFLAFSNGWYGKNAPDFSTFVTELPAYSTVMAPKSMDHRYLREDVKQLLVFTRELAARCGSTHTHIDSVIKESGYYLKEDLLETGMTLKSLGLENASIEDIMAALNGHCRS